MKVKVLLNDKLMFLTNPFITEKSTIYEAYLNGLHSIKIKKILYILHVCHSCVLYNDVLRNVITSTSEQDTAQTRQ